MNTNHAPQAQGHAQAQAAQAVSIELLAIDLSTCTRCVGTLNNITQAIELLRPVLEVSGTQVEVTTRVITTEAEARQHRFVSSPTVRVNGQDLVFETLESQCDSCSDLCGCEQGTQCRVWLYQGQEFTEAPVGLVLEAVLRAMGHQRGSAVEVPPYAGVPENLSRYFRSKTASQSSQTASCCSAPEQAVCCVADARVDCCDSSAPAPCGCR